MKLLHKAICGCLKALVDFSIYVYNFDNKEALKIATSIRDDYFPELSATNKRKALIENSIRIQVAKININKSLK